MTVIGLQVNQVKHEQNYFQDQNLKASVPKCSKVIFKIIVTIQMADSKSLLSLPLPLAVQ